MPTRLSRRMYVRALGATLAAGALAALAGPAGAIAASTSSKPAESQRAAAFLPDLTSTSRGIAAQEATPTPEPSEPPAASPALPAPAAAAPAPATAPAPFNV